MVILVIVITVIILGFWYFSVGGENEISEKVKGNNNKIQNEQHREISLLHIENLGDTVQNLDGKIKIHSMIN